MQGLKTLPQARNAKLLARDSSVRFPCSPPPLLTEPVCRLHFAANPAATTMEGRGDPPAAPLPPSSRTHGLRLGDGGGPKRKLQQQLRLLVPPPPPNTSSVANQGRGRATAREEGVGGAPLLQTHNRLSVTHPWLVVGTRPRR